MHALYVLGNTYPYWAIPIIVILVEVGIFFHRKKHKNQYYCWGTILGLSIGIILWLIFRGDRNFNEWLKWVSNHLNFGQWINTLR